VDAAQTAGRNVGRWDYWAADRDVEGRSQGRLSIRNHCMPPNMIPTKFNALMMLMGGMKNGELENAAPASAVMIYQTNDPR
jgi:malate synthase